MNDEHLAKRLEGLLFALGKSLSRSDLARILEVEEESLERAVKILGQENRGIVLVDDGSMIELRVAPEVAPLVEHVRREENTRDIGRAGLEVLSALLYRGPLSRAEVDFIRGVNSSATLRTLTVRGLIRRKPHPKDERSFLYEPTTELLAEMGATHVRDLPDYTEVRERLAKLEVEYRSSQEPNS